MYQWLLVSVQAYRRLPQDVDLFQQLYVPIGHIEPAQLIHARFEALHSFIARSRARNYHQSSVNVLLLFIKLPSLRLECGILRVRVLLSSLKISSCIFELSKYQHRR